MHSAIDIITLFMYKFSLQNSIRFRDALGRNMCGQAAVGVPRAMQKKRRLGVRLWYIHRFVFCLCAVFSGA